ncbi:hypothetical protein BKA62DRAFT_504828 [Auriculariales sp. MPI-PUGE-AT-0066]|nr:hypothetical protein BKA62DRAFT_504828 [Auriculariales sp. MPI-PUGE-AT-0066]
MRLLLIALASLPSARTWLNYDSRPSTSIRGRGDCLAEQPSSTLSASLEQPSGEMSIAFNNLNYTSVESASIALPDSTYGRESAFSSYCGFCQCAEKSARYLCILVDCFSTLAFILIIGAVTKRLNFAATYTYCDRLLNIRLGRHSSDVDLVPQIQALRAAFTKAGSTLCAENSSKSQLQTAVELSCANQNTAEEIDDLRSQQRDGHRLRNSCNAHSRFRITHRRSPPNLMVSLKTDLEERLQESLASQEQLEVELDIVRNEAHNAVNEHRTVSNRLRGQLQHHAQVIADQDRMIEALKAQLQAHADALADATYGVPKLRRTLFERVPSTSCNFTIRDMNFAARRQQHSVFRFEDAGVTVTIDAAGDEDQRQPDMSPNRIPPQAPQEFSIKAINPTSRLQKWGYNVLNFDELNQGRTDAADRNVVSVANCPPSGYEHQVPNLYGPEVETTSPAEHIFAFSPQ